MKFLQFVTAVTCLFYAGCGDTDVKFPGGGVKIENGKITVDAPGVNVNVEPGQKVEVSAPGVEVNHRVGEGVDVKAPGTTVKARRNGDVEVTAPGGVNVDTNPDTQLESLGDEQPRRVDL